MLSEIAKQKLGKLGIGKYQKHILFCGGDKCCNASEGDQVWNRLKERLAEIGLERLPVYRTRTTCLRVCDAGPIMVIYPEGVWYANVNLSNVDRVIDEHLLQNRWVDELIIAKNPLPLPKG